MAAVRYIYMFGWVIMYVVLQEENRLLYGTYLDREGNY